MIPLQNRFNSLLNDYTSNTALITSLWNDIEIHYSEEHRMYHNLQHLAEVFSCFDTYENHLESPDMVAFSIFYHDIIYNVWKKDNEERSADFAFKKLTGLINDPHLSEICNQILATKTHNAKNNDTQWLVDFDLAILGQNDNTYKKYTELILKEYKTVPSFIYKKGRKKVLQHFLDKSFIFATPIFRELYEKQAKENLYNELQSL